MNAQLPLPRYARSNAIRDAKARAERIAALLTRRCVHCRGPMRFELFTSNELRHRYCSEECRKAAAQKRYFERKAIRKVGGKQSKFCTLCLDLPHRRSKKGGCRRCQKPWGPDVIYAVDHMFGASNLARVMQKAELYGLAAGGEFGRER